MSEVLQIPREVHPKVYIEKLQARKIPVEQIAEMLGLSTQMIFYMKKHDREPRWSLALRLLELNEVHCSTATATAVSGFVAKL